MNVIAWHNDDGGKVSITIPAYNDPFRPSELEDTEFLDAVRLRTLPRGAEYIVIDVNDQPGSRVFRDAWRIVDKKVIVDMDRAQTIHMDKIRSYRNRRLEVLDVEFLRAIEQENDQVKASITALKKTLRDIPQTFDLTVADTPEKLEALWPAILS